jgi:hypothetical protein
VKERIRAPVHLVAGARKMPSRKGSSALSSPCSRQPNAGVQRLGCSWLFVGLPQRLDMRTAGFVCLRSLGGWRLCASGDS